jgi:pyrimidine operon attenuation protein/uracil phosphoribosyltransferase
VNLPGEKDMAAVSFLCAMSTTRTQVLDHDHVQRKLQRIAIQLCEENYSVKEVVIVGIAPRGAKLAQRLADLIEATGTMRVRLAELSLDKDAPLTGPVKLTVELATLKDRTVVLVDDVLMSGRTLMHAAAHLVQVPLARLTTVVLVDRRHRTYPIRADIVGLTLSTTVQEHITVELGKRDAVYIS